MREIAFWCLLRLRCGFARASSRRLRFRCRATGGGLRGRGWFRRRWLLGGQRLARFRNARSNRVLPPKSCAATTLREPTGCLGMVINGRGPAMSAGPINSARSRRARSAEDESPVIVAAIAVLAVVVLSCGGMLAPVLWDAFVGGADNARFQPVRPHPRAPFEPLIPHL